ncbi:hypothetical protein EDB83DRAFT_280703 [Lactarius deliciosus]|nr:hypothetical protein EDB83DRAFT_280703 [Lactarius deliciosus]
MSWPSMDSSWLFKLTPMTTPEQPNTSQTVNWSAHDGPAPYQRPRPWDPSSLPEYYYIFQNQHRTRTRHGHASQRQYPGCVLGKPPASGYRLPVYTFCWFAGAVAGSGGVHTRTSYHYHHHMSSRMPSSLFSRRQSKKQRIPRPHLTTSDDHPLAHDTVVVSEIGTHGDMTMSTIQTSLAALKEGSALATKLPFIAPIAGLLLQALTMRDEVRQYKEECEIVMHKLARIARIIVDVGELCEHHNLNEEDLPAGLRTILGSLQRELDRIERVLKECSKRKGIKRMLLRKDLLTKIKQCDVEISNVLQAFQVRALFLLSVSIALHVFM